MEDISLTWPSAPLSFNTIDCCPTIGIAMMNNRFRWVESLVNLGLKRVISMCCCVQLYIITTFCHPQFHIITPFCRSPARPPIHPPTRSLSNCTRPPSLEETSNTTIERSLLLSWLGWPKRMANLFLFVIMFQPTIIILISVLYILDYIPHVLFMLGIMVWVYAGEGFHFHGPLVNLFIVGQ